MIIDFHHHYMAETAARNQMRRGAKWEVVFEGGVPAVTLHEAMYDLENRIQRMDAATIDVAAVSGGLAPHSIEDCRAINDQRALAIKSFPRRMVGLATVNPTLGVRAIEEVKRAIYELGFKGVHILAFPEGRPLDSRSLWGFYREVERMGVPIYVHPGNLFVEMAVFRDYDQARSAGREFELALATTRLILGGVLEEFSRLKFVISHLGGGISAIKERLDKQQPWGLASQIGLAFQIEKGFDDSFSRLYFDTAGFAGGVNALLCALTTIKPERLVFGTDYPQDFVDGQKMKQFVDTINNLNLSKSQKLGILGNNAKALLGLGKATA